MDQNLVLELNGEKLTISQLSNVARNSKRVSLGAGSIVKINASRAMLDKWIKEGKVVYGITTGFGPMVSTLIPPKYQTELQENLIRSHSANVGPIFSQEETRAAMALRINTFAKGYSGIRLETVELLKAMLNHGIHPRIPQWGSVGASGDLTPSAHIGLALMGEGDVEYQGAIMPAKEALSKAGLQPVEFVAKEGLALINGTTMMTGVGALQVHDAWNIVKTAEIICTLSLEGLLGSTEPFLAEAQALKPHPGQLKTAANLLKFLDDSQLILNKSKQEELRDELQKRLKERDDVFDSGAHIQNVYSMRATPQILGAVRDALDYITARITTEMNSSNDNPLFIPELGISYQGAHFHGQPVALPMDVLSIALTEVGVLSERRLNKMLDELRSGGLSPFLARGKPGLNCGFEGAQYIPTSLVAECRTLCTPVSIQSIPSNGENQDVVSMGLIAARKARDIKERIEYILAVELLAACEALEQRGPAKMGHISRAVFDLVRTIVPTNERDRVMTGDFEKTKELIHGGGVVSVVEKIVGTIQ